MSDVVHRPLVFFLFILLSEKYDVDFNGHFVNSWGGGVNKFRFVSDKKFDITGQRAETNSCCGRRRKHWIEIPFSKSCVYAMNIEIFAG